MPPGLVDKFKIIQLYCGPRAELSQAQYKTLTEAEQARFVLLLELATDLAFKIASIVSDAQNRAAKGR